MSFEPILLAPQREEREQYPYGRVWRTAILQVVVLLAVTVAIVVLGRFTSLNIGVTQRRAFGLAFAFLPFFLWVIFAFAAERRAPEPRQRLLSVVILSALAANAVGILLVDQVLSVNDWLIGASGLSRLIGYMVTVGIVQEFIKYAVIRYSVWPNAFRTRSDGVAYGLAAAVGYATVLSLNFALNETAQPAAYALRTTEFTLSQMATSVLIGYFLAELKLSPKAVPFWLPGGLMLASALDSLETVLRSGLIVSAISDKSTGNSALPGITAPLVLASISFASFYFLINNADERSKMRTRVTSLIESLDIGSTELNFRQRWASYLTIAVAVGALAGGFWYRSRIVNATIPFENKEAGISGSYPASWLLDQGQTDFVFRIQDPASIPFKTTVQVSLLPIGQDVRSPLDVLNPLNITRAASLTAYSTLQITPITLGKGVVATQMTYAYAYTEVNPILQTVPVVVQALDVVVLRSSQVVIITFACDSETYQQNLHYFTDFLRTLEF